MIIADNVNIPLQAKEGAFVEYLKSCEGGKVPAKAPEARVRHRERKLGIVFCSSSGEGGLCREGGDSLGGLRGGLCKSQRLKFYEMFQKGFSEIHLCIKRTSQCNILFLFRQSIHLDGCLF